MKKTIVSMLALSALVYSCKKDDDKSTSELIQGKWNVTSIYENEFYNNMPHRDTSIYAPGAQTVEFTNKGSVYFASMSGSGTTYRDTGVYKLEGPNLIMDGDTFKINSISGSDMQLYSKDIDNIDEYDETTVNLKK
jgi:hypothetical protein